MIEGKHRIPDHTEFAGNDKIGVFLGFLRGHHIWLEFISGIRSKKKIRYCSKKLPFIQNQTSYE